MTDTPIPTDAPIVPVTWPPEVGARIHYNSGHRRTSWTAEVRAVVDDFAAVILKTWPTHPGRPRFALLDRIEVEVFTSRRMGGPGVDTPGPLRVGPLPASVWRATDGGDQ